MVLGTLVSGMLYNQLFEQRYFRKCCKTNEFSNIVFGNVATLLVVINIVLGNVVKPMVLPALCLEML